MAKKPVCDEMNGDTKVAIQGSTTGPKQDTPSPPGAATAEGQETTKTLTEINQEDTTSSVELGGNASEVLRIQNGRLICENLSSTCTTATGAGKAPMAMPVLPLSVSEQAPEPETQLLDFNNQNSDASVNISIDSGFLDNSSTALVPVIQTVNNVACEEPSHQAVIPGCTHPEVTGTTGIGTCVSTDTVQIHDGSPQDTMVFRIETSDKTEVRDGEAVNVINIPETGDNVSAGFALVSDLITTEDLVTMTSSVSDTTTVATSGPTIVVPLVNDDADGLETKEIVTQVGTTTDETSSAVSTILNASAAPILPVETSSSESQLASKLTDAGRVTEIDLGTANSASGMLQLNVASLNPVAEAVPTTSAGQQIIYMVTSRDKTTGLMQRFRVTVDPENVTHLPIGAINLGNTLPGLAIGAGDQILSGDHVVSDSGSHGNLLTSDGDGSSAVGAILNSASGSSHIVPVSLSSTHNEAAIAAAGLELDVPVGTGQVHRDKSQIEVYHCIKEGCNAVFTQRTKLKLHQLSHANDRPFKCEHEGCEWAFQTLYKLRRHEAGHTGLKPYMCGNEGCGKTFSTIYNLNIHLKLHKQLEYVACEVEGCGEVFPSKVKLEIHQRKHFEDKQIKCHFPGCGKSFTTSSAFGSHQRIHQREEQMYSCPVEGCDKIYDKACRLKLHLRSHTGERPFKCTFEGCKWAFTCQQKLSRHMVRHTGDRKYQCKFDDCNKLFTRLEHLKGHLVSHSGEKPYACTEPDCNARFSARSSLYMHVKRHKQGKPMREKLLFSCPFDTCNKSFNTKLGLKNHMVKEHGIQLPALTGAAESPSPMDMVYIPTETIQMALEQFGDISGTANASSAAKTVVQIKSATTMGPGGDNASIEPILQQAADAAERSMEASTSLTSDLLTQPTPTSLVTAGGLINDVPAGFATSQLPSDETTAQSRVAATCKVYQENRSGSARTDFMYKIGGIKKPPSLEDEYDSDQSNDGSLICASYANTTFTMTTSASLMLRDPTTGARFVQSQLLQDDPPDENDMVFSLTPPPSTADQTALETDLHVSAILPGNEAPTDQCSQSATADFLQSETTGSEIEGFRESTINLQDLE